MTIRQQGGVFGRNPSFNDVDTKNLSVEDALSVGGSLDVSGTASLDGLNVAGDTLLSKVAAGATALPLVLQNANSTTGNRVALKFVNSTLATYQNYGQIEGVRYADAGVGLNFKTSSSAGPFDRLTITQLGDVLFYKDDGTTVGATWDASAGNLAFASGAGIDFSATSGTGTSELFDDYEEGTWTPAWTNLTVGDGTSTGRYTKFGRTVFVEVDFLLGSTSVVGSSPEINNLPFASAADFLSFGVGSYTDAGTNTDQASCTVVSNSNRLIPFRYNISAPRAYQAPLSATTPFTWAANDRIRLSVTYTAAG